MIKNDVISTQRDNKFFFAKELQERIYQEKPIFQGLQRLWKVVRCAGIYIECNTYATNILICIGHFSVVILGNVLFCAFLQAVQQTVNRPQ